MDILCIQLTIYSFNARNHVYSVFTHSPSCFPNVSD